MSLILNPVDSDMTKDGVLVIPDEFDFEPCRCRHDKRWCVGDTR